MNQNILEQKIRFIMMFFYRLFLVFFCFFISKEGISQNEYKIKELDVPNKIINRNFDYFNHPHNLTITKILYPITDGFKYPYDTLSNSELENYFGMDTSVKEIKIPFYISFLKSYDTVECHCLILDSYTTIVYEKGNKKLRPKSAKVYIMEKNKEIIAVYVIDPYLQQKLDFSIPYNYMDIKLTDLVPLKREYRIGIGDNLNYISFVSNNYFFKDVLLNPYYIICN